MVGGVNEEYFVLHVIDKILDVCFTLLGVRFSDIGIDSLLHKGMLFCGVMGEMHEDYTIWAFHNG